MTIDASTIIELVSIVATLVGATFGAGVVERKVPDPIKRILKIY